MDVVLDVLPQQAITDELKQQDLSTASYYNADGIIFDLTLGIELVLFGNFSSFSQR